MWKFPMLWGQKHGPNLTPPLIEYVVGLSCITSMSFPFMVHKNWGSDTSTEIWKLTLQGG